MVRLYSLLPLLALMSTRAGSAFCPSVILQQGRHFDFVCSGANIFSTVSFAKDGNPIDFNVTTKYSKNYILLRVSSLTTEDSAVYTCTAVFGGRRTDFCNNLTVNVNPMAKPVIYTTSPKRLVLRKGSSETLVCHSPSATIVLWYKDGKPLSSSALQGRIRWSNTSQKLHVLTVLPEDSANYSCEALNQGGASWEHFERIVQETGEYKMPTALSSTETVSEKVDNLFRTNHSPQTTRETRPSAVTTTEQLSLHRVSADLLLENMCEINSDIHQPEIIIFTAFYERLHDWCSNCSFTYLSGERSARHLEDVHRSNCAFPRIVLRTAVEVDYSDMHSLFQLFYKPLLDGEDTLLVRHRTWSSKWRIIRLRVMNPHQRSLSFRNLNYAHAPSTPTAASYRTSWSAAPTITHDVAPSSSSTHAADGLIVLFSTVLMVYGI